MKDSQNELTLKEVQRAAQRIAPFVRRTSLARSRTLSQRLGTNVYLKLEMFQRTGAFKVRGAFNKMLTLTNKERHRGVVAVSGGNHAQAVACAAQTLGLQALILMPEFTPSNYSAATRQYGAEVLFTETLSDGFEKARHYESLGWTYVHPFDDPLVMAGQGTIGLEILEDLPNVTDVIFSVGGGGLLSGLTTAVKSLKPKVRLWGVETKGADSMAQALTVGRVVELPAITSIARTLGSPVVSQTALNLAQQHLENLTVVSDEEAVRSLRFLLERAKVLTEPASSCTLAAAEKLKGRFSAQDNVALVLCGGNIAVDDLLRFQFSVEPANLVQPKAKVLEHAMRA
jgi:threonine dehydratase